MIAGPIPRGGNTVPVVDLRSDTVTKPTSTMLSRMMSAELGDDGQGDDPTVRALEATAAQRLGKQAGLFLPSGTMSNHVAILTHASSRGEVIGEAASHIFRSEMGGLSLIAGLYPRPLPGHRGAMDLAALADALASPTMNSNQLGTSVVCVETTHNSAGGTVLPLEHLSNVQRMCREKGVPLHLDGARIFNASVAKCLSVASIAQYADSVTFCLSKALSAPVGSVLTGTAEFIARARGFRRLLGGNMRQAGLLAACGIVALEEMVDRLAEDHTRARNLAHGLNAIDDRLVPEPDIDTNILMVNVAHNNSDAIAWRRELSQYGVLCGIPRRATMRFVTHRHIDDQAIETVINVFRELYTKRLSSLFAK